MKTKAILLCLMLLFASLPQVLGEDLTAADPDMKVGEHLDYKITWLGIPVGSGELLVKEKTTLNGREVFHVVGRIETNKVLSKIFPIHDEAHSWIDAATFESVQFEKKIDELIINTHEKWVFDAAQKKGHFVSFKSGEKKEFDITVPVHDVLSAFFWARRQPLEVDQTYKIVLTADQRDWELQAKVAKKEKIKIDDQKIETLKVYPDTVSEGVERRGKAWFNVTTDPSHRPVRIIYKAPIGRITGTLQKADQLTGAK